MLYAAREGNHVSNAGIPAHARIQGQGGKWAKNGFPLARE